MQVPWASPEANGYERSADEQTYLESLARSIVNVATRKSLLDDYPAIRQTILDIARMESFGIQVDTKEGIELWKLHGDHARLNRAVLIRIARADWDHRLLRLDIRAHAAWVGGSADASYVTREQRWWGLSTDATSTRVRETLQVALTDARSFTVDNLLPHSITSSEFKQRVMP